MSRGALGLGAVPSSLDGGGVTVRQPGLLGTGVFLALVVGAMAVAVLHNPGLQGTNAFLDRWVFGAVIVPAAFGIHRFLLRPRIVVGSAGVRFDNAFSALTLPWADIADARGGEYVEVVGTDGDCARALVYGPAFSGPLTRETRPRAVVALIRAESARRAGREPLPEDYAASPLVADEPGTFAGREPVIHPRPALGLPELAAIAVVWTLACALAAALA